MGKPKKGRDGEAGPAYQRQQLLLAHDAKTGERRPEKDINVPLPDGVNFTSEPRYISGTVSAGVVADARMMEGDVPIPTNQIRKDLAMMASRYNHHLARSETFCQTEAACLEEDERDAAASFRRKAAHQAELADSYRPMVMAETLRSLVAKVANLEQQLGIVHDDPSLVQAPEEQADEESLPEQTPEPSPF